MRRWLLAFLCLALVGCGARGATTSARDIDGSIIVGGAARTYHVHLPPQQSTAMPLLLVLHGSGGTGAGTITLTHMNDLADQRSTMAMHTVVAASTQRAYAVAEERDLHQGIPVAGERRHGLKPFRHGHPDPSIDPVPKIEIGRPSSMHFA